MSSYFTGLNRHYLIESAKAYGIALSKYMDQVAQYENEMLKKQNRQAEENKQGG